MVHFNLIDLPGWYELTRVIEEQGGAWVPLEQFGGFLTLSSQGKISLTWSQGQGGVMASYGDYSLRGQQLILNAQATSFSTESTEFTRTLLFLDSECLIIEEKRAPGARKTRSTWKKIAYLQAL